jgi:hypothetical protein
MLKDLSFAIKVSYYLIVESILPQYIMLSHCIYGKQAINSILFTTNRGLSVVRYILSSVSAIWTYIAQNISYTKQIGINSKGSLKNFQAGSVQLIRKTLKFCCVLAVTSYW